MVINGIRRYIIRFNNSLWNDNEKKYNINKREYYSLLKTLKKYKYLLIKIRFVIELNGKFLVI